MKRQLIFLYRYFTTSRRWRRWINAQTVLVLVVSVVFLGALMITAPFANAERPVGPIGGTITAEALSAAAVSHAQVTQPAGTLPTVPILPEALATPTKTPLPPEYLNTDPQTIGISLGALVLVLIVVIGFFSFFHRKED